MPRDGSGNYTLPAGNPVVDGTAIETTWANPTMNDIAVQLNNVLTRDGLLGPTLPIKLVDGTAALPGLSFSSATGTGLYRTGTVLGFSWAGVSRMTLSSTGVLSVPGGFVGNLTGTATSTAATAISANGSINVDLTIPFMSTSSGTASMYSDFTVLYYNPSTNTLTCPNFAGIAASASQVVLSSFTANATHFPVMSLGSGNTALGVDTSGFSYNPSTNTLTATNIVGALTGNATSASTVAATALGTAANFSVSFLSAASGNVSVHSDTGLQYNPSTNLLTASISGNAGTATNVVGGTYTPTGTSGTGITLVNAIGVSQYMRVGSCVTVSGLLTILTNGIAGDAFFEVSLPVASNFTNNSQCCGSGLATGSSLASIPLRVIADTLNNRAQVMLTGPGASQTYSLSYIFTYTII